MKLRPDGRIDISEETGLPFMERLRLVKIQMDRDLEIIQMGKLIERILKERHEVP